MYSNFITRKFWGRQGERSLYTPRKLIDRIIHEKSNKTKSLLWLLIKLNFIFGEQNDTYYADQSS